MINRYRIHWLSQTDFSWYYAEYHYAACLGPLTSCRSTWINLFRSKFPFSWSVENHLERLHRNTERRSFRAAFQATNVGSAVDAIFRQSPESFNAFLCDLVQERMSSNYFDTRRNKLTVRFWAQDRWPPCTNKFRSAAFTIESIIYLCYKTTYFNEEVNCTEPPPSVNVPWSNLIKWSSL